MIPTNYNPKESEEKWYNYWLEHRFFHSEVDNNREPYCVVIPPPNVTGILHMGHMLNNTIQDALVRRARLQGKNACWVPGTDHASIATEAKVVAKLQSQGIKKTDLTREEFLKHAWEWTHTHGGIILKQLRRLGASCDWERTAFTMDEIRSESVLKVFVDLYNKGLIYRGVRMVNWDPKAQTALSDEEVIYREEHSKLYYLRYRIEGEEGYAIVATTRPETIMGDTAMCINPKDPKNQHLRGKKVIVPLVNRVIPVIEDEYVDIEFGTGCLKVTPAHDVNDYMLGEKHNLPSIDIFNDNGTLSEAAGLYVGMDRFEVRKQIEQDLQTAGLLEKVEPYTNNVGYSERTNVWKIKSDSSHPNSKTPTVTGWKTSKTGASAANSGGGIRFPHGICQKADTSWQLTRKKHCVSPAKKAATASCNLPTCAAMKTASTPGSPLGCGPSLFSMASTIPAIPKSITITRLATW